MQCKLTARSIRRLEPADKPYEVRDTEIKGFLLRREPTGRCTYYLEYKNASGQRKRYRIGAAAALTPEQARDVAKQESGKVALGYTSRAGQGTTGKRISQDAYSWYLS